TGWSPRRLPDPSHVSNQGKEFAMLRRLNSRSLAVWLSLTCLLGLSSSVLSPLGLQTAYAYQEEDGAKANSAPAAGGVEAEDAERARRRQESFLAWMVRASGIFGFLILLVSFVMVALTVILALQLRRHNSFPAAVIEVFEQKLNAKDYQGAFETAKS